MDLGQAVRAATQRQRQAGSYLGTVTAIDAGNAALTIDIGTGVPLTGVRWVGSYAPTVNDFVTVLRSGSAWTVLGKLSKDLRAAGPVRGSTTLAPAAAWSGIAEGVGTETSVWSWLSAGPLYQGAFPGSPPHVTGSLLMYPPLSTALPSGAVVESARLSLTRDWDDDTTSVRYVRLHGHAATTPPSGNSGPPLVTVSGYSNWIPGSLTQGQTASWPLPSTWITAMLAGTITGLSLYSTSATERMSLLATAPITITYHL